jgi:hypothetical protein
MIGLGVVVPGGRCVVAGDWEEPPVLIGPKVKPPPPPPFGAGGGFGLLLLLAGGVWPEEIEEKTKGAGGMVEGAVGVPVSDAKTSAGQQTWEKNVNWEQFLMIFKFSPWDRCPPARTLTSSGNSKWHLRASADTAQSNSR